MFIAMWISIATKEAKEVQEANAETSLGVLQQLLREEYIPKELTVNS
jgi:hypothetical protein